MLLQYYAPHRTGLTLHVQNLAEELVRRGHHVTVITARHDVSMPKRSIENGVLVHRLWAPLRVSRGMIMPSHPIHVARAMGRADVISMHTPMFETAFVGALAQMRRKPVVITHHGDLVLPPGGFGRLIERMVRRLHRIAMRSATRVVAYSEDYASHSMYLAGYADKTVAITPPLSIPDADPKGSAAMRQRLVPASAPMIGFAGRFVREKRPDVALRSLETVQRLQPGAVLVFAGENVIPYEDTWKRNGALVARHLEHLRFLGMVSDRQELADFYAACDVLVLPSDTECFGLVQVEAMLCGTPVVMTDIPGGRVPVQRTGMGLLVRPGDPVALGQAILHVLEDPKRFRRTREEVVAALGLDTTIARYEEVFDAAARS